MKDLESRNVEYCAYITEHKNNVIKACTKYGDAICNILEIPKKDLEAKCLIHDESKYSEEEFAPYRDYFYPIGDGKPTEAAKEKMNRGWLHHQNVNPHHPEYWMLSEYAVVSPYTKALPMTNIAIAEMLCDWIAMGMKFNSNPYAWFISKKKYYLHIMNSETFKKVEDITTTLWKDDHK
jgi:hypothetical protein